MLTRTSKGGLQDSVLLSDAVTSVSNKDGGALLSKGVRPKGDGGGGNVVGGIQDTDRLE